MCDRSGGGGVASDERLKAGVATGGAGTVGRAGVTRPPPGPVEGPGRGLLATVPPPRMTEEAEADFFRAEEEADEEEDEDMLRRTGILAEDE